MINSVPKGLAMGILLDYTEDLHSYVHRREGQYRIHIVFSKSK